MSTYSGSKCCGQRRRIFPAGAGPEGLSLADRLDVRCRGRGPHQARPYRARRLLPVDVSGADVTLRLLLQVHAADVAEGVDAVLYDRGEILWVLPGLLERRFLDGRKRSVDAYVSEIDGTLTQLRRSTAELAAFIREPSPSAADEPAGALTHLGLPEGRSVRGMRGPRATAGADRCAPARDGAEMVPSGR